MIQISLKRAPVAQVVVHSTSKQEVRGSIPEPVLMEIFLSTSTRGSGGSEPTLNCVGPIIKRSVASKEETPCRGANYLGVFGWFWEIYLYWFWKTQNP